MSTSTTLTTKLHRGLSFINVKTISGVQVAISEKSRRRYPQNAVGKRSLHIARGGRLLSIEIPSDVTFVQIRGWADNTSWADNTYSTVHIFLLHDLNMNEAKKACSIVCVSLRLFRTQRANRKWEPTQSLSPQLYLDFITLEEDICFEIVQRLIDYIILT